MNACSQELDLLQITPTDGTVPVFITTI